MIKIRVNSYGKIVVMIIIIVIIINRFNYLFNLIVFPIFKEKQYFKRV